MTAEVFNCITNLQCDIIDDGTSCFTYSSMYSNLHRSDNEYLINMPFEGYHDPEKMDSDVGSQSPGDEEAQPVKPSITVNQEMPLTIERRQLRKRSNKVLTDNPKRAKNMIDEEKGNNNLLDLGNKPSSQRQGEVRKTRIRKIEKGKDGEINVKSVKENMFSRDLQTSSPKKHFESQTEALEWDFCVSLLKNYGVVKTREFFADQELRPTVPHPGFIGDGVLCKLCKKCGAVEGSDNTVICDECQEAFHLSCCAPRITYKHFKHEDYWFCHTCRKNKKKMGSRFIDLCSSESSMDISSKVSKVALGPAYQAEVPLWLGPVQNKDQDRCLEGHIGMEIPLAHEEKDAESERMQNEFKKSRSWLSNGAPENWLRCNNVIVRAFTDPNGKRHGEVICGKWRRAPPNVEQSDEWECFCAMEWDPLHADCAIPQERPTEEILMCLKSKSETQQNKSESKQVKPECKLDDESIEVPGRKATLRRGKSAEMKKMLK